MVWGRGFRIALEDHVRDVGFYTTRAVQADSLGEAGRVAEESIWRELREKVPAEHLVDGHLEVEEVEEVGRWWRRLSPPAGFTWYMADDESEDGADVSPGE
jgi:hypothetical protein